MARRKRLTVEDRAARALFTVTKELFYDAFWSISYTAHEAGIEPGDATVPVLRAIALARTRCATYWMRTKDRNPHPWELVAQRTALLMRESKK